MELFPRRFRKKGLNLFLICNLSYLNFLQCYCQCVLFCFFFSPPEASHLELITMVFFLQDWAKGNRGRNNDTFTSTWRRRRKNNNNNNIVWLSWSKTETNFRVTCGFFVVPKKRTRIELKKHKFNINHMLKGWCLEKKEWE